MLVVAKNEFFKLFKSIKSILVILVFICTSYYTAKHFSNSIFESSSNGSPYYSSLRFCVFILGYIFVSTLSHDCINGEIESQTIRLVISKISRKDFLLGKFIGITLFWCACILISSLCIILISSVIEIKTIITMILTCIYFISIVILNSCIIPKSSMTNFIGIVLGFIIPGVGLYCYFTENALLGIFKYLFPYYYAMNMNVTVIIIGIISAGIISISYFLISRKDL